MMETTTICCIYIYIARERERGLARNLERYFLLKRIGGVQQHVDVFIASWNIARVRNVKI